MNDPAARYQKLVYLPPDLKERMDVELSCNGSKYRAPTGHISANVLIVTALEEYLTKQERRQPA